MRKLSQKELLHEGFGGFLKSLAKSAAKKVASDLAKDNPALAGVAGAFKTAAKAGRSAKKRIEEYLLDYNKMMVDEPKKGKGGRYIVKTAKIEYDQTTGQQKQGALDQDPMILKIDGDRIRRLDNRGRGFRARRQTTNPPAPNPPAPNPPAPNP